SPLRRQPTEVDRRGESYRARPRSCASGCGAAVLPRLRGGRSPATLKGALCATVVLGGATAGGARGRLGLSGVVSHVGSAPERGAHEAAPRGARATIVVCTRDRPDMLADALRALRAAAADDAELLVVDSASTS